MKKIYLSILSVGLAFTVNAQLSLTKAFNEPVIGNTKTEKGFDSTTVVPKNTGAGQTWNFSSLITNTMVVVTNYTTVAASPSPALFPTATETEDNGSSQFNYWKQTTSTFELLGFADNAGSAVQFTNSAVAVNWPVAFGYSSTDVFAGTATISLPGTVTGTITTTAPGSGTVILPGSSMFTNILQLRMVNHMVIDLSSTYTVDVLSTEYNYFHSSQKFQILTVNYEKQTLTSPFGPTVTTTSTIKINNAVLTGINNFNMEALNYNVYPNPATDAVNIDLSNDKSEAISVVVMNNLGQVVKSIDLGNAVEVNHVMSTADLTSGIYYVKTSIGDRSSTKKLIIQ